MLCERLGCKMERMCLCSGIHKKTDVLLPIHLIVGGEILTQHREDQGKNQCVHTDGHQGRLTRHPDTTGAWWQRQKDAWCQQHEQHSWHNQVSWAQRHLQHEAGNQVVHQGQDQGVDQHWAGTDAQEQTWAEQSEQDGWGQNLGSGDVHGR